MGRSLSQIVFTLVIATNSISSEVKRIYIEEHPSSLLLARNEIGNFSCRAYCNQSTPCFGQWIIDGKTILNESDASHTGFTFSKETTKENEHSLRLSVNASESNNNSMIQCEYQSFQFGYRSNFSNRIVTRSRTARVIVLPNKIEFKISSSAVNTSVLFKGDGTPVLVEVYIELPAVICSLQQLLSFIHYSFKVEDRQGGVVTHAGPFTNLTSCTVRNWIEPNYENYTLTVLVGTQSQNITSCKHSFSTYFSDHTHNTCGIQKGTDAIFSYQLIVIVSLGLVVFLLISVLAIVLLLCVCINHKRRLREKGIKKRKNKVCKNMVHNPLYDRRGPQYEFVPSRLESSAQFTRPVVDETRATHPHYDTINTPRFSSQQDMPTADTHRNVDQPHSADRSSHRPSKFHSVRALSSSNTHNLPYDIISTSTSSSVPAPTFGLMGLKKNGQERNKLHLTLSLGNVDRIVGTHAPGRIHEVLTSDSESDNYTFLNPIASRQNAGFNILPDAQNDTLV